MARHRAELILGFLDGLGKDETARQTARRLAWIAANPDQTREDYRQAPPDAKRAADRLRSCGDYLLFHHYHTVDQVRLHAAYLCQQHLVCPLCAIRRGSKQVGAYLDRFEALTAAQPALRPVLITYTVKNGPDLAERMAHLRAGLRKLTEGRNKARQRAGASSCTWRHLAGAVGALETTWSRKHGWHPHAHMVGLCDGWMDQRDMVTEWRRITGDSFVVGIQQLDPSKPPAHAFLETFKYAVKFGELPPARVWEAAQALRGQRLIFSLGSFRGVPEPAELTDEPLDGLPFAELFFRYLGGGHYGLTRRS